MLLATLAILAALVCLGPWPYPVLPCLLLAAMTLSPLSHIRPPPDPILPEMNAHYWSLARPTGPPDRPRRTLLEQGIPDR